MENSLPGNYGYGSYGYGYPGNTVGLDDLILSNQMANGHQHIGDKIHTASMTGISETAEVGRDVNAAVRDAINASNQIGNINLQSSERNGGENRATTERASGVVRDHLAAGFNQVARDHSTIVGEICDVRKEMATEFGHTNLHMSEQHCEIKKDVLEASYKSAVQHGEIKLEMCRQHAELARQIDARAAEAAAALAKCCCKAEQDAAETRALILSTDNKRVEAEVNNLRQELLLAKINGNGPGNSGN